MTGTGGREREAVAPPRSPCVDICKLDDRNVCTGCFRTIDEIVRWAAMTADEQWRVVRALEARRSR